MVRVNLGLGRVRNRVLVTQLRVVKMFGVMVTWLEITLPKTLTLDPNPQNETVEGYP